MRLSLPLLALGLLGLLLIMVITAVPTHAMIIQWVDFYQQINLQPQFQGWNITIPSQYAYRLVWMSYSLNTYARHNWDYISAIYTYDTWVCLTYTGNQITSSSDLFSSGDCGSTFYPLIVIGPSSLPVVNVFYPAGGSSYPNNQNGEGKSPEPVPYSSSGLMYYGMFQSSAYLINYLLGTGTFYLTPASLALYATEHVVTYDYFLTRAFGYYFYSDYPLNPVASLSTSNHFVNIYVFAQRAYREVADAALNVTIDGYSLNAATGGDSIGRSENYIANQPIQQASLFSFSQGSIDLLQSLGKFNWVSYNVSFSWSATVYATDFVIVQAVTTLPNGQSTSIPVQYWNPTISISLNKVPSQWKSLPFYSNFARGTVVSNGQVVSQVAWLDQNDQAFGIAYVAPYSTVQVKAPSYILWEGMNCTFNGATGGASYTISGNTVTVTDQITSDTVIKLNYNCIGGLIKFTSNQTNPSTGTMVGKVNVQIVNGSSGSILYEGTYSLPQEFPLTVQDIIQFQFQNVTAPYNSTCVAKYYPVGVNITTQGVEVAYTPSGSPLTFIVNGQFNILNHNGGSITVLKTTGSSTYTVIVEGLFNETIVCNTANLTIQAYGSSIGYLNNCVPISYDVINGTYTVANGTNYAPFNLTIPIGSNVTLQAPQSVTCGQYTCTFADWSGLASSGSTNITFNVTKPGNETAIYQCTSSSSILPNTCPDFMNILPSNVFYTQWSWSSSSTHTGSVSACYTYTETCTQTCYVVNATTGSYKCFTSCYHKITCNNPGPNTISGNDTAPSGTEYTTYLIEVGTLLNPQMGEGSMPYCGALVQPGTLSIQYSGYLSTNNPMNEGAYASASVSLLFSLENIMVSLGFR